ncbi:MerR family transcriptional regulator [Jeotgalibaca dankookensis]|uniref:MerR family transcriptional regulator n=1 Tax=Jeotgalibaca dankookensis TaxID=708126 RepID=UPI00078337C0|nr:MerR family transcriptional regulator [Jeotgalibaca dankookensis]
MKELENVIEYITPKDAAEQLGVATQTLRKYANLFDKVSETDYFHRDSQNARIYSNNDITAIKRMLEVSKTANETLENAVSTVIEELDHPTQATQTESSETTPVVQEEKGDETTDITVLQQAIVLQNNMLGQYGELMQEVIESNEQLKVDIQALISDQKSVLEDLEKKSTERDKKYQEELERFKKESEKKGFFARLFKK